MEGTVVKTLRIKREFMLKIQAGTKKIEYRDYRDHYHKMFDEKITHLKLHYQQSWKMLVEVKRIRVIKTPRHVRKLETKAMQFGKKVYAIELGRSRTISL